jgi:hypothetical protein
LSVWIRLIDGTSQKNQGAVTMQRNSDTVASFDQRGADLLVNMN